MAAILVAAVFLAGVFLAGVFLAGVFLAGVFLAAAGRVAEFAFWPEAAFFDDFFPMCAWLRCGVLIG